jgi:ABC-type proline/glycine betaine transport system permease subunit
MIRRLLIAQVEIPLVIALIWTAMVIAGLWSTYYLSLAFSVVAGSIGVGIGIKLGREQIIRVWQRERDEAASEILPQMLSDEHMPEMVRTALQYELRAAQERLAR